jgi:pyrroloquinoline quinone biosynthesis protein E
MSTAQPPALSAASDYTDDGAPLGTLPAPEPVPDINTYLRERRISLSRSSARLKNFIAYSRSPRRSADVNYLPVRLDFENVSRCNFACTMCTVSEWHKGTRAADMPLAEFKRLIDEQYGLVEIKIQGLGEPTLQRDDYFAMIRYARSKNIWVRTTTNASLLHLHNNYKKLVDSGVNEIQISIDGADKETFESIRRQSVFERVVSNCKLINGYCDSKGIERTKMWTVVQKGNRHQLSQLVDLAHEMGFKSMGFSLNLVDFGVERWREINDAVTVEYTFTHGEARELMAKGKQLGIKVRFWSVTQKYTTDQPEKLCPWPFERAYISSDLRIVPCCIIGNPDVSEIGSARESFSDSWFGPEMRRFREAHLKGEIPAVCQSCYDMRGQSKVAVKAKSADKAASESIAAGE